MHAPVQFSAGYNSTFTDTTHSFAYNKRHFWNVEQNHSLAHFYFYCILCKYIGSVALLSHNTLKLSAILGLSFFSIVSACFNKMFLFSMYYQHFNSILSMMKLKKMCDTIWARQMNLALIYCVKANSASKG